MLICNDNTTDFVYDDARRITRGGGWAGSSIVFGYDKDGNPEYVENVLVILQN